MEATQRALRRGIIDVFSCSYINLSYVDGKDASKVVFIASYSSDSQNHIKPALVTGTYSVSRHSQDSPVSIFHGFILKNLRVLPSSIKGSTEISLGNRVLCRSLTPLPSPNFTHSITSRENFPMLYSSFFQTEYCL